uniref:Uncharacterized protein n=1 Tax=Anguilla anguilla TaxID=7936 RepID=A0A0E9USW9_ANGAN
MGATLEYSHLLNHKRSATLTASSSLQWYSRVCVTAKGNFGILI